MRTADVMAAVDELREAIEDDDTNLSDIPNAVDRRDVEYLKAFVAADEDDKRAIDKWFSHTKQSDRKESDVEAVAVGAEEVEYVVVRSEMWSRNKASRGSDDGNGSYHAVWLVGVEDGEYWIHRLEWDQSFEGEQEWTIERVRRLLGYDDELPTDSDEVEFGTQYRAQGDLTIEITPYDEYVDGRADNRARTLRKQERRKARRKWAESALDGVDGVRQSMGRRIRVKPDTTDDLKELQEELEIAEEDVCDRMDDDWDRLTAKRRSEIIKRILSERRRESIDTPALEDIKEERAEEIRKQHHEQAQQTNLQYGNHLVIAEEAVRLDRDDDLVAPGGTMIHFVHDEHEIRQIETPPALIEFSMLERHERS